LLDDSRHVLQPPGRPAARPVPPVVERRRDCPQRDSALAQAVNLTQHGLLAGVGLDVLPGRRTMCYQFRAEAGRSKRVGLS